MLVVLGYGSACFLVCVCVASCLPSQARTRLTESCLCIEEEEEKVWERQGMHGYGDSSSTGTGGRAARVDEECFKTGS